jgi:hypothetical protein
LRVPFALGWQRRADRRRVGVDLQEDAPRGGVALLDQREQDVLGIGLLAAGRRRRPAGELDRILGATGERRLVVVSGTGASADHPQHRNLDLGMADARVLENARRPAFVVAQQREQDVLGADVAVV